MTSPPLILAADGDRYPERYWLGEILFNGNIKMTYMRQKVSSQEIHKIGKFLLFSAICFFLFVICFWCFCCGLLFYFCIFVFLLVFYCRFVSFL